MVGRARFLALYFLSGLAGSALVYWGDRGALGASGAIFGLMGALADRRAQGRTATCAGS